MNRGVGRERSAKNFLFQPVSTPEVGGRRGANVSLLKKVKKKKSIGKGREGGLVKYKTKFKKVF